MKDYLYLSHYEEKNNLQTAPIWCFYFKDAILFEKEYGLQTAKNLRATLFEVNIEEKKVGVMVR